MEIHDRSPLLSSSSSSSASYQSYYQQGAANPRSSLSSNTTSTTPDGATRRLNSNSNSSNISSNTSAIEEEELKKYDPELDSETMFSPPKPSSSSWLFTDALLPSSYPTMRTRLLDRDGAFNQSKGRLSVRKKVKIKDWRTLYVGDWFHSLIDMPTYKCIAILLCVYISIVIIFAIPYYHVSMQYECNMGIENFFEAFVFALQTQATIGYGTQDIFFGDCWFPVLALTSQICIKIIIDAIAIGVIYSRLSRPQSRASTILFSKNCIVKTINDQLCLMFRVCELRKHQLIGSQIRLYAIKLEKSDDYHNSSDWHYHTYPMRVHHPDDTLGSMLLMAFPQYILHYIDDKSPLNPNSNVSRLLKDVISRNGNRETPNMSSATTADAHLEESTIDSNAKWQRGVDASNNTSNNRNNNNNNNSNNNNNNNNNNNDINNNNSNYNNNNNSNYNYNSNYNNNNNNNNNNNFNATSVNKDSLIDHWNQNHIEIVAILEGVDPTSSGVLQCRHSYLACSSSSSSGSEVIWHKTFAPCVFHDPEDGAAVIDFSKFHDTY